jgi:hypothetical protein
VFHTGNVFHLSMRGGIDMNWEGAKAYVLARLQEASTWRGIVLMLTVAGYKLSTDWQELVVMTGIGLSGFLGAVLPDKK